MNLVELSHFNQARTLMRDKNIVWLYLFLLATLVDIYFILEQNEALRSYSKPVILAALLGYFYFISAPIAKTILAKTILAAPFLLLVG